MAKELQQGQLIINFDSAGQLTEVIGHIVVGSTDDPRFVKPVAKAVSLTAGQQSAVENFLAAKLGDLLTDEGIS